MEAAGGRNRSKEAVGRDRHPLQDGVADHHQSGRAGSQAPGRAVEETGTVVEILGRVVGPAVAAVDALVGVARPHRVDGFSNLLVGD